MATVISATVTDNVATVELDDASAFTPGTTAYIFGIGGKLDGARQLLTVDTDTNEITYTATRPPTTDAITPPAGMVATDVDWISSTDVETYLGIEPTGADADYLDACTAAAQEFAYKRRWAAGYDDNPNTAPSLAVKQGATIYAGTLYRERGSSDAYQSYDQYQAVPVAGLGQVMRLLGINRVGIA